MRIALFQAHRAEVAQAVSSTGVPDVGWPAAARDGSESTTVKSVDHVAMCEGFARQVNATVVSSRSAAAEEARFRASSAG